MNEQQSNNSKLPPTPEPYWRVSTTIQSFPSLKEDKKVDVVIVGGGITGITTAYLLGKEGLHVALLESDVLLNGTTGHTTAKITSQHGLIYDELIQHFGQEKARLYYEATKDAAQFIKSTIKEKNISCDLRVEDAYVYTNSEQYIGTMEKEMKAYEKLGIDGALLDKIALPVPSKRAIVMNSQAQFHPLQYLSKLVDEMVNDTVEIYENTTAIDIEEGIEPVVITKDGYKLTCDYVVSASHFPFCDGKGLYFARMYADRSYIIAAKTERAFEGGMYVNAELPSRSLRYTSFEGEKLLLISGESHKTGQGKPMIRHYEALEAFGDEYYGIIDIPYRWSTQDLTTLDKVPYIGRISANHTNLFVATGYRKWGMTNGTAAALILRDYILKQENPYMDLYNPSRFVADPSIKHFIMQNIDVARHYIEGKLDVSTRRPEDLALDEGGVVTINGQRAGAYKDKEGNVHIVNTTCTHMTCELEWNSGDRTWDCPCHGSRFSVKGDVVEGPAKKPLKKIE